MRSLRPVLQASAVAPCTTTTSSTYRPAGQAAIQARDVAQEEKDTETTTQVPPSSLTPTPPSPPPPLLRVCVDGATGTLYVLLRGGLVATVPPGTGEGQLFTDSSVLQEALETGKCVSLPQGEQQADYYEDDTVVCFEYLGASERIFVATAAGALLLVDPAATTAATTAAATGVVHSDDNVVIGVERIGTVDVGIAALAWSPDQEVAALITGAGGLLVLTQSFHVVAEGTATPDRTAAATAPVNVGWGARETQFQGRAGKAAARMAPSAHVEVPCDDGRPRITWRGDGEYFATCFGVAADQEEGQEQEKAEVAGSTGDGSKSAHKDSNGHIVRTMRVWDRAGVLQSTGDLAAGGGGSLEQSLAWRPSGSLVASTRRMPHRHEIVFFERNGLPHGGFVLPWAQDAAHVRRLAWNADSAVLAVWAEGVPAETGSKTWQRLQFWTTGNYHWYLQQEFCFDLQVAAAAECNERLVDLCWHEEDPWRIFLVTTAGLHAIVLHTSPAWQGPTAGAPVAVLDGNRLLLTPFERAVVPPPMAARTVEYQAPVCAVAWALPSTIGPDAAPATATSEVDGVLPPPRSFAVALADGSLALEIKDKTAKGGSRKVVLEATDVRAALQSCNAATDIAFCMGTSLSPRHMTWLSRNRLLLVLNTASEADGDTLVVLQWDECVSANGESKGARAKVTAVGCANAFAHVLAVAHGPGPDIITLQTADGMLLEMSVASGPNLANGESNSSGLGAVATAPEQLFVMPSPLGRLALPCPDMAFVHMAGAPCVVGLSRRGELALGDVVVATNVSSFGIHAKFLLITTTSHKLQTVPRTCAPQDVRNHLTLCADSGMERAIERGARIVSLVPDGSRVVLQMPRGNLETINPRPLVLTEAARCLEARHYGTAFDLLRRHRVSLNLLFDYAPTEFLEHTAEFVRSMSSCSRLDLFLGELVDADVTATMYPMLHRKDSVVVEDKRNVVCKKLREAMISIDADAYLSSVLTSWALESPPNITSALRRVQEIKVANKDGCEAVIARSLKTLLILLDEKRLYRGALVSYELEFALMVAQATQMDPKEYLPFLNKLHQLPPNEMRFEIDVFAGNFTSALRHLSLCGPTFDDKAMSFIAENSLYPDALEIYKSNNGMFPRVAEAYGANLCGEKRFEEAGAVYECGGKYIEAADAYKIAGLWRNMMAVLRLVGADESVVTIHAKGVVEVLRQKGEYLDAGTVLATYLSSEEDALVELVRGEHWNEAQLLCRKCSRADLIETHLRPGVVAACAAATESFSSLEGMFERHLARLTSLRKAKAERARLIELGVVGEDGLVGDVDLFSDTTSVRGSSVTSSRRSRSSASSRTSARSAKNRRKEKQKHFSLREGGRFEEEALVHEIKRLATQAESSCGKTRALCLAAVAVGEFKSGREAQSALNSLLSRIKKLLLAVWPPKPPPETLEEEIAVEIAKITPPVFTKSSWMVSALGVDEVSSSQ